MAKTTESTSTALAVIDPHPYPVLRADATDAIEAMRENLGGSAISPYDLDRIKVPAGGSTTWSVPTLAGEEDAKTIAGIIVHHQTARGYWRQSLDESGGGTPPDCASHDGQYGVGDPGGACARCPMNEWGSKGSGRGKACQERHLLFVLREGEFLPILVNVPPSSLGAVTKLLLRLTSKGVPYFGVVVELGLARDKSGDGITYSKITIAPVGTVASEDMPRIEQYRAAIVPALRQVKLDAEDYETVK
jgi:hypothetical protein